MFDNIVHVANQLISREGENGPETARIWKKHSIEHEGHVLGDGDASTILPGDFTLPVDDVLDAENLEVTLKSLELFATVDLVDDIPRDEKPTPISEATEATEILEIKSYSAMMIFTVKSLGGDSRDLSFNISYDVHFVTAHPCVPSHHTNLLDSLTSPPFQVPKTPPQVGNTKLGPHELHAGMYIYFRTPPIEQGLKMYPNSSRPSTSQILHLSAGSSLSDPQYSSSIVCFPISTFSISPYDKPRGLHHRLQ
jgi:hypothetical protein